MACCFTSHFDRPILDRILGFKHARHYDDGAGEDYLTYAYAKGLKETRIFGRYAVRNAMLPQVTALALDLGRMVSGAVLVEILFNYPGVGMVLFNALRTADYMVIQGVVMFIITSVALATLLVDLIYPLLDPRIMYQ